MTKQSDPKPTQRPSEPRHDGNKGRTTPKPRIKPRTSPPKK